MSGRTELKNVMNYIKNNNIELLQEIKKKLTDIIILYNKNPTFTDFKFIQENSQITFNGDLKKLYNKFLLQLKIHLANLTIKEEIIEHLNEFNLKINFIGSFQYNKYLHDFLASLLNVKINPVKWEKEVFKKYDLNSEKYFEICTILFCYSFESISITTVEELLFFINTAGKKISNCKYFDKYKF